MIVRSIIDLGHNLGLEVVAEGVEDDATLTGSPTSGCDRAQGFLIGRPMPATSSGGAGRALGPAAAGGPTALAASRRQPEAALGLQASSRALGSLAAVTRP